MLIFYLQWPPKGPYTNQLSAHSNEFLKINCPSSMDNWSLSHYFSKGSTQRPSKQHRKLNQQYLSLHHRPPNLNINAGYIAPKFEAFAINKDAKHKLPFGCPVLQWMSGSYPNHRSRDKDLEFQRQGDWAADKSGINTEESSHFEGRIIQEAEIQEHLQELHAWDGKRWQWRRRRRNEEFAVLLWWNMPPLYLDTWYWMWFLQDGEATIH